MHNWLTKLLFSLRLIVWSNNHFHFYPISQADLIFLQFKFPNHTQLWFGPPPAPPQISVASLLQTCSSATLAIKQKSMSLLNELWLMLLQDGCWAWGGEGLCIPGAVSSLCMCVRVCVWEGWGVELKVDRGEDCSHQHLGSDWPLKLRGVFDGSGHGGMLLTLPPRPKSPRSCGMRRKLLLLSPLEWD